MISVRAAAFVVASVLLSGCGGTPSKPMQPPDMVLQRESDAGKLALTMQRPSEAVPHFQQALSRAKARDDAGAIGDSGYNLTVANLAANRPKDALDAARMTRIELARRNIAPFPALILAEATSLYRLGDNAGADSLAAQVEGGSDASAAAGAAFLRGLIADERGDQAGLNAALARLRHPASATASANAFELAARRDLRDGQYAQAASGAARAVALRRDGLEYRGMARALALQAKATQEAGHTAMAANLYIRAAQSAAAQGDAGSARPWLGQALALANTPALRHLARRTLAGLDIGKDGLARH